MTQSLEDYLEVIGNLEEENHNPRVKDIAERLGISGCLVTKRTKKIIEFIKNDKWLSSILRDLL